jgi:hypothetical protein
LLENLRKKNYRLAKDLQMMNIAPNRKLILKKNISLTRRENNNKS